MKKYALAMAFLFLLPTFASAACDGLPGWQQLKEALTLARKESNGGFNLDMWATLVGTDGTVCAVAFTGAQYGDQWLGSRVISAQKANTANAFSLPGLSLSTADLYSAVQPGGSLYGLQASNPVDTKAAYAGKAADFGSNRDPMVGERIGGVNVFGGGLALYDEKGLRVGAIGVSGDSSCADHNIAWKARHGLNLDYVPGGVSPVKDDNIIFLGKKEKPNGFKHPTCGGTEEKVRLPAVRKKKSL
jgi:uncharacterized protein GlcG (DUF336 family)